MAVVGVNFVVITDCGGWDGRMYEHTACCLSHRVLLKSRPSFSLCFTTSQHESLLPDIIDHSIHANSQILNDSENPLLGQHELYINKDADISTHPPIHPTFCKSNIIITPPKVKINLRQHANYRTKQE